jgi:peptidoglycan/xylan/chitin deacetylase (PgdA/CDA1 family)
MNILKNILYVTLYGIRNILSIFYTPREVSVLCYHDVAAGGSDLIISQALFREQMEFLKKHKYYFATLSEVVDYILGNNTLPKKTVAITFDDGYEGVYLNAFPILSEYKIPATIFLTTTNSNLLDSSHQFITQDQLNIMKHSGLVQIGHHSATHQKLSLLDPQDIKKELLNPLHLDYFAYPGGNYSQELIQVVKDTGFTAAFSIKPGIVNPGDDIFLIKRNVILGTMSFWQFKLRVTRAIEWYRKLLRTIR